MEIKILSVMQKGGTQNDSYERTIDLTANGVRGLFVLGNNQYYGTVLADWLNEPTSESFTKADNAYLDRQAITQEIKNLSDAWWAENGAK
jgi:hypothetical protein